MRRSPFAPRRSFTHRAPRGRGRGHLSQAGADRGFATAEAAVVLPVLLVVLALAVGVVVTVGAQLRCVDAARVAARVAARGDTDAEARRAAQEVAPRGARVQVRRDGDRVLILVEADVRAGRWMPAVHVAARAAAEDEDVDGEQP